MKALLLLLSLVLVAAAADAPKTLSWRDRYTLGPGDVLNIGVYGRPDLDRAELSVQPDGTITFLQAQSVPAAGRTIDELRLDLQTRLGDFYKRPRLMVSPFELRSKKYYIMGKVIDNGAFVMDRPITILEAVARSRGISTGLYQQNTVELADLERSFLIRHSQRVQVDFQKLFFQGDMSQNLELEPGDYLYFPSSNSNDVYCLGEVVAPGVQGFTNEMTALGLVARREGFTKGAYRERVLVVRGSADKPQLIVVDTNAVLKGKQPDFRLQPKDIVFVSARPWRAAEELMDSALSAFVQSAVTSWTGQNVGPFLKRPIIPSASIR